MATPDLELLDRMLELQKQSGAAQLCVTAHGYQRLKTALSVRRKRDSSWFSVQLSVRHLDEREQRVASTGGMITMEVTLCARPEGQKARGQLAAELRGHGVSVDVSQGAMTMQDLEIQEWGAKYDAWRAQNPTTTKEEAHALGFGPEWDADENKERRAAERKHNTLRVVEQEEDFFAKMQREATENIEKWRREREEKGQE